MLTVIVVYHAPATLTGGAGCLHASPPAGRKEEISPSDDEGKKIKKIRRPPAGLAWAQVLVRPGSRAASGVPK